MIKLGCGLAPGEESVDSEELPITRKPGDPGRQLFLGVGIIGGQHARKIRVFGTNPRMKRGLTFLQSDDIVCNDVYLHTDQNERSSRMPMPQIWERFPIDNPLFLD